MSMSVLLRTCNGIQFKPDGKPAADRVVKRCNANNRENISNHNRCNTLDIQPNRNTGTLHLTEQKFNLGAVLIN